jgi:hypothetical protein
MEALVIDREPLDLLDVLDVDADGQGTLAADPTTTALDAALHGGRELSAVNVRPRVDFEDGKTTMSVMIDSYASPTFVTRLYKVATLLSKSNKDGTLRVIDLPHARNLQIFHVSEKTKNRFAIVQMPCKTGVDDTMQATFLKAAALQAAVKPEPLAPGEAAPSAPAFTGTPTVFQDVDVGIGHADACISLASLCEVLHCVMGWSFVEVTNTIDQAGLRVNAVTDGRRTMQHPVRTLPIDEIKILYGVDNTDYGVGIRVLPRDFMSTLKSFACNSVTIRVSQVTLANDPTHGGTAGYFKIRYVFNRDDGPPSKDSQSAAAIEEDIGDLGVPVYPPDRAEDGTTVCFPPPESHPIPICDLASDDKRTRMPQGWEQMPQTSRVVFEGTYSRRALMQTFADLADNKATTILFPTADRARPLTVVYTLGEEQASFVRFMIMTWTRLPDDPLDDGDGGRGGGGGDGDDETNADARIQREARRRESLGGGGGGDGRGRKRRRDPEDDGGGAGSADGDEPPPKRRGPGRPKGSKTTNRGRGRGGRGGGTAGGGRGHAAELDESMWD